MLQSLLLPPLSFSSFALYYLLYEVTTSEILKRYKKFVKTLWFLRQEIITRLYRDILETYSEKARCTPFDLKVALDKAGEIIGILEI
jgi:hypothetical protein